MVAPRIFAVAVALAAIPCSAAQQPRSVTPESRPLAARSGPRGATLFATLSSAQTGISAPNPYDDPSMWREHYREFSLGCIGTGVAIGDYDGDGRPDVFIVAKTGANHLFRNLGGFRFEDATERAGVGGPTASGVWKQGAAFADVNNDGRLDLYVCRFNAPNLLYINQGDGAFREEASARGLALSDASGMGAFCDYDRDGWLDVFVQTNLLDGERRPNGQRDHLFRNNRDGTFVDVTDAAGIKGDTQGHSATWWDFDEDGWPDLYVANDFKDPDQLFHNNRDGTFTNVLSWVVPHTPHSSMGADFGDLNNDGHLDLLVADMEPTSRVKNHRGMAKLKAALTENEQRPEAAPQYMRNALFLGTGTGRVLEAAQLAGLDATDWTWSVRFEDLDLDGRLDVHFTNGMVRELHQTDIVARMLASESFADRIRIIKASPVLAEQHLVFRNLGDLRFENTSAAWGLGQVGMGTGAAFGDLDGDGDLDLVFVSYDSEATLCRNDMQTGHAVLFDLQGTSSNRFGVGATVHLTSAGGTQIRTLVLARGYLSTSEPVVAFGLGEDTTVSTLSIEWPSGHAQTFHDLAVDRRYTITEPEGPAQKPASARPGPPSQFLEISRTANLDLPNREKPLDELSKQPLLPWRFQRPGPAIALADFDGDGNDDLALGGVAGGAGQLVSSLGAGQYLPALVSPLSDIREVSDGPLVVIDANGDGSLDLLVTKAGVAAPADTSAYQPRLFLGNGRGRFAPAADGTLPIGLTISVGAACAADFQHTGHVGVFLGGRVVPGRFPEAPRSALLAWRDGRYVDVTAEIAPTLARRGMVTAALWTDVDGDGWIDLLVAYDWGTVACYRNNGGAHFDDDSERLGFSAAGTGWWRAITAADFNGDGKLDYAVGNAGLNTRYRASATEPALLYAGVVLDGSAPQLVEAQAERGRWFPLRTRETMAKVFPSLARRFPTADAYSRATIEEVFSTGVLDAAGVTKLAVTELQSGVFLSQADRSFRFTPLPRLAQIAPVHGMVAADLDGDGRTDLAIIGNDFGPVSETGRFDGGVGWVLRGDGRGGFTPAAPAESGLIVPGDARSLAVTDLDGDGWPDLVATRNNDRALVFANHRTPGRHAFGVALRGPPGNPTAIGARATLKLADGSTQILEVEAGGGSFAQSSATLFFGFPDNTPPKELAVRWPDGRTSVHPFTASPTKIIRISAP